jgi:hypothetical protein
MRKIGEYRKNYVCQHCGGSAVSHDAAAIWDIDKQEWVVSSVYDNATCETCGGETKLIEVNLDAMETSQALEIVLAMARHLYTDHGELCSPARCPDDAAKAIDAIAEFIANKFTPGVQNGQRN